MDEQQVRQLVRLAIARHLGAPHVETAAPAAAASSAAPSSAVAPAALPPALPAPLSFARFHLVRPAAETECLIEPSVACTHCGHCQCYGH